MAVALAVPLLGCLSAGCGDEDPPAGERPRQVAPGAVGEHVESGDPLEVLAVLRRPHAAVREQLGPHALTCATTLSLTPTEPSRPNPAVGAMVSPRQSIADTVALRWDTPDDDGPRFALEQHNDKERGRSVVITAGTLYAKLEHRAWTFHAVESDVHELWLDDAWHAGHDALEFLLPAASVASEAAPGEGWNGGDAVRLRLTPGEGPTPPGRDEGWRKGVAFSALAGTLLVDTTTGAWLALDATATYTVSGGAGGPLEGHFEVHGRLAPTLPEAPHIAVPNEAVALPQRHRYEEERKRLLDGLAAP